MVDILRKKSALHVGLLFFPLGIFVYFSSFENGFVFDDSFYVTENYMVKNFSLSGVQEIFTNFYGWDYLPLTFLSLWLDYFLYGLNPAGYHLTNTLLHITNAILLYGLASRLAKSEVVAFWVALLFLIHPVHVESVAWISERKNVLSLFFFILSFTSYLSQGPRLRSVILFLCACLSKSTVVILPLLLVLYDFCFLEKKLKENLLEKLPYFLVALIVAGVTVLSQSQGEALRAHPDGNPVYTLYSMIPVFKEYLVRLLFPVNLNIWYPKQVYRSFLEFQVLFSSVILGLIVFLGKVSYRKYRVVFFGLVWFVISLLPVSNIVPLPHMMADRFMYIPSIGIFMAAATVFRQAVCENKSLSIRIAGVAVMVVVINFTALSVQRMPVFKDNLNLWTDSIRRNENNTIAMMYLGTSFWIKGNRDKALEKFARAEELDPENIRAAMHMGQIQEEQGNFSGAEKTFLEIIEQKPDNHSAYNHLAVLYGHQGKLDKALSLLDKALSLDPSLGLAHYNRAVFLLQAKKMEESLKEFQIAVELEPKNSFFQFNLGMFYSKNTDRPDLGRMHLEESLRLNPDQAEAVHIREVLSESRSNLLD